MTRTLTIAAALALAAVMLLRFDSPTARDGGQPANAPAAWTVDTLAPGGLWGRDAFVPDWQAGERLDRQASAHFLAHWLPGLGEPLPSTPSTTSSTDVAALRLFATDYWVEHLPDAEPPAAPTPTRLKLVAALGESEPLAIGVHNPGPTRALQVRVDEFRSADHRLTAEHASPRLMLPYPARAEAGDRPSPTLRRPMVLLAPTERGWTIPAGETRVVTVDVHVPLDATPGRYQSRLSITSPGAAAQHLAVELEVLPFRLKVNGFHAGAFVTTYNIWSAGFTGYYPEMIEMDARYGFNIAGGFFNKGNEIPFRRDAAGRITDVDEADPRFARFDQTMQQLARHGMGDVLFWNWGATGNVRQFNQVLRAAGAGGGIDTDAGKRGFAEVLRAIKAAERRHGWPEMVINPFDEALKDQDATREIIEAIPLVDALSPDTRLYMTEWRPGYAFHYQSSGRHLHGQGRPREQAWQALQAAGEQLRLNFEVIGSNVLSDDSRRLQDALGGQYWHYTGATQLRAETRFAFGFRPWIQRSESVLMWANYKGSFDGAGWTLHYVMPLDPDGRRNRNTRGPVIPSVRALAVREGIDDRKYIETLRYHAWRLGSQADLQYLVDLAQRARALLLNARDIGGLENVEGRIAGGAVLDEMRAEVRARILALLAREAAAKGD